MRLLLGLLLRVLALGGASATDPECAALPRLWEQCGQWTWMNPSDITAAGLELSNPPMLLVVVVTGSENHITRAAAIASTWGSSLDTEVGLLYMYRVISWLTDHRAVTHISITTHRGTSANRSFF